MKNLLRIGFTEKLIEEMIANNDYETVEDLDFNYTSVANILNFFQIIGIKNARRLLINYINIFFLDLEYIQKRFAKNGLNNSVNMINEEIDSVMNILYDED